MCYHILCLSITRYQYHCHHHKPHPVSYRWEILPHRMPRPKTKHARDDIRATSQLTSSNPMIQPPISQSPWTTNHPSLLPKPDVVTTRSTKNALSSDQLILSPSSVGIRNNTNPPNHNPQSFLDPVSIKCTTARLQNIERIVSSTPPLPPPRLATNSQPLHPIPSQRRPTRSSRSRQFLDRTKPNQRYSQVGKSSTAQVKIGRHLRAQNRTEQNRKGISCPGEERDNQKGQSALSEGVVGCREGSAGVEAILNTKVRGGSL
jgi:hypothetical protein